MLTPNACFVALGTRGDVQPILMVSMHYSAHQPACFITHKAHEPWIQAAFILPPLLQLKFLDSAPARVWDAVENVSNFSEQCTQCLEACRAALQLEPLHLEPQCQRDTCRPLKRPRAAASHQNVVEASHDAPGKLITGSKRRENQVLAFNMFSLECYHIAEAYRISAVVLSPCIVSYRMPATFRNQFSKFYPELYAALREQQSAQHSLPAHGECATHCHAQALESCVATDSAGHQHALGRGVCHLSRAAVTWSDIEHWMWPLFLEKWSNFRQDMLDLGPCPFIDAHGAVSVASLQQATPVLYGVSGELVAKPTFWPRSVQLSGFWIPSEASFTQHQRELPSYLQRFLKQQRAAEHLLGDSQASRRACELIEPKADRDTSGIIQGVPSTSKGCNDSQHNTGGCPNRRLPVLCVDFGSMGRMGLVKNPVFLAEVVHQVAARIGLRVIVLTAGWRPLEAAFSSVHAGGSRAAGECAGASQVTSSQDIAPACEQDPAIFGDILVQRSPILHQVLLPHCDVLLHHGGAGTTAAAAFAGIPQVVCPMQFDQFVWAEKLAYYAVAPPAVAQEHIACPVEPAAADRLDTSVAMVAKAVRQALTDKSIASCCKSLAKDLAAENSAAGAVAAADCVLQFISSH